MTQKAQQLRSPYPPYIWWPNSRSRSYPQRKYHSTYRNPVVASILRKVRYVYTPVQSIDDSIKSEAVRWWRIYTHPRNNTKPGIYRKLTALTVDSTPLADQTNYRLLWLCAKRMTSRFVCSCWSSTSIDFCSLRDFDLEVKIQTSKLKV